MAKPAKKPKYPLRGAPGKNGMVADGHGGWITPAQYRLEDAAESRRLEKWRREQGGKR